MTVEKQNKKLFVRLAAIALGMFGFGYALVPFYYQICAAWGVNLVDRPSTVENTQVDQSRVVTIELDSNIHHMAWTFRPLVNAVKVHPGELTTVEYEVVNTSTVPVTGQAVASYGPQFAGEYFKKLECFCFTQQTLAPGETRRMPVVFVVDSRLPKDVNTIALSYTFFQVEGRGGKIGAGGQIPPAPST
jgi:cytochrome c oxidase assembly protein subunit 11